MQVYATLNAWFSSLTARRGERGATAVEYGLIVALIAAVIIGAIAFLGDGLLDAFTGVGDAVNDPSGVDRPTPSAGS